MAVLFFMVLLITIALFITASVFKLVGKKQESFSGEVPGVITDICYYPKGFNECGIGEEQISSSYSTNRQQHMAGLIYTYTVNGEEYKRSTSYLINENQAKKKVGNSVQVRFDPSNPAKSSISGNPYGKISTILFTIGIAMILITVVLLFTM